MSEQLAQPVPSGRTRVGLGTLVALALAAAFVAWILLERSDDSALPVATPAAATSGPRISTAEGLSALAALRAAPVYWAGPRAGVVYEVTENAKGHVFVRYLASGTEVGSPEPKFLTVATYPRPNALAEIQAAAKRAGAVSIALEGGLAVLDRAAPTSVYLAYRGAPEQIEFYAASATLARRLVESGRVKPVP